jgi:two-component system LytT family response regulator
MIKAFIVDDEEHCIITLKHILSRFKEVQLLGAEQDSIKATSSIKEYQPDLVFLDIEMPAMNGFDLLAGFDRIDFKVIFTTAYDQYAIQALRLNALDYLLKPVAVSEVARCLEKYQQQELLTTSGQIHHLQRFNDQQLMDTIALSTQQGLLFVKIEDIVYLEASSCYTNIIMKNEERHLVSKTLANFEEVLEGSTVFFRAHKSYLINLRFIRQYNRGDGGEIIMADGSSIAISRNKKQEFLSLFKKI